jgi:hypothetical protein
VLSFLSLCFDEGLDVEISWGVCFRYHKKWRILRPGSAKRAFRTAANDRDTPVELVRPYNE